jgi:hypothetical protein
MLALILGSALAVTGLIYVLMPLMRGAVETLPATREPRLSPEASGIDALREIEFDRATGKLSDEDYASLKATYTPRALDELRAREAAAANPAGTSDSGDQAELLIQKMKSARRVCANCGPRPEGDALFCSNCGRAL